MSSRAPRLVYSPDNDSLFHLNYCTAINRQEKCLLFYNRLFNISIRIDLASEQQEALLCLLRKGATESEIVNVLDRNEDGIPGPELFKLLLRGCALE